MRVRYALSSLLVLAMLFAVPGWAVDQGHQHGVPEKLGKVNFPTSCSAQAQKTFERGLALLHSFAYEQAENTFREAAAKDDQCAIAWWGAAMSVYHPLWAPPYAKELEKGAEAVAKARAASKKSERENDYIEAIAAFYQDHEKAPHNERSLAWETASETVAQKYPDDPEARIFWALAIRSNAAPTDKSYERQKRAGAMLEEIFRQQPEHPGLAHYIIHCYDYPALAERGLDAARRYAKIAPDAPHALHMPSHIFTRLGLWQDSISSNRASADSAVRSAKKGVKSDWGQALHALDYLMYAYLQSGQESQAEAIMREVNGIAEANRGDFAASYALAATPARFYLERHRWAEAAALPEPPAVQGANFWNEVANGIAYWARAVGKARSGKPEDAAADIAKLEAIREKLKTDGQALAADTVEVMRLEAKAWKKFAAAQNDEARAKAVEIMRAAADLEDRTDKHPVTPGAVLPAREQLGDLLMEVGRASEALREYEAALKEAPNRLNSLDGAARAADKAGKRDVASGFYRKLLQVTQAGEMEKVRAAKEYLARK